MKSPHYTSLPDKFWAQVDEPNENGCWLWTGSKTTRGYGQFYLNGKQPGTHLLAAVEVHGPLPSGLQTLHHCDVPLCVRPSHLYYGTRYDNMQDMVRRGRHDPRRGEKNGRAKLTEKDVLAIRGMSGIYSRSELAERFNIAPRTVYSIISRERWAHLSADEVTQ